MTVGPLSGGGNGGGSFVTSGLRFHYDIGDTSSYSGTGTTVNDLSGNGLTATLIGSLPTYVSDGSASHFEYTQSSGADGRLEINNLTYDDLGLPGGTFDITITWWFKPRVGSTSGQHMMSLGEPGSGGKINTRFSPINPSSTDQDNGYYMNQDYYFFDMNAAGGGSDIASILNLSSRAPQSQDWHNYTMTLNATTGIKQYINAVSISPFHEVYWDNSAYRMRVRESGNGQIIGTFDGSSTYSGTLSDRYAWGNIKDGALIAQSAFYNRALTDAEVLQNYNALKSRYGY